MLCLPFFYVDIRFSRGYTMEKMEITLDVYLIIIKHLFLKSQSLDLQK